MEEKFKKIQEIMSFYETTFDWGCNDSVHSAIAHAVYGVITSKEYFLEEYNELLSEIAEINLTK